MRDVFLKAIRLKISAHDTGFASVSSTWAASFGRDAGRVMNRRHVISWAAFACLPPVAAQPAASAAPDRHDWLKNFGPARQPWIDKLRSLRQGRAEVFRIVQIGDSHTAGDFFTGGLRAALQERWGNAGVG